MTILVAAPNENETARGTRDARLASLEERDFTADNTSSDNKTESFEVAEVAEVQPLLDFEREQNREMNFLHKSPTERFRKLQRRHPWRSNSQSAVAYCKNNKVRFNVVSVRELCREMADHVCPVRSCNAQSRSAEPMFGLAVGSVIVAETDYSIAEYERKRRFQVVHGRRRVLDPRDRFDLLVQAGLDPVEMCVRESERLNLSFGKVAARFLDYIPLALNDHSSDEDDDDDDDTIDVLKGTDTVDAVLDEVCSSLRDADDFNYFDIPDDYFDISEFDC